MKRMKRSSQANILCGLIGCLVALIFCRGCAGEAVKEVPVEVEKIVYVEAEHQFDEEAQAVARVLYGLSCYQLSDTQKTAVIEVIMNRVEDTAREFRNYNTVQEVCDQPNQWQGYDPDGDFLKADYNLALKILANTTGARVTPEGCYFMTVSYAKVTVRTEFNGGNEWTV